jgi:hypothetical protein
MTEIVDLRRDVGRHREQPLLDSGLSGVSLIPTRRPGANLRSANIAPRWSLAMWCAPFWRWVQALDNRARGRLPSALALLKGSASAMRAEPLATVAATYRLNGPDMTQLGRGRYGA